MGAGWSDSNNLYIWVNKPAYAPGEQVNGEVFLNVVEEIHATRLALYLDGEEDVRYVDSDESRSTFVAEKMVYFSESHALLVVNGTLATGRYRFPFCFTLPASVAPDCSVTGEAASGATQAPFAGRVRYKVRAQIEEEEKGEPSLKKASLSRAASVAALAEDRGKETCAASHATDNFEVVEVSAETPEQLADMMKAMPPHGFLRRKLSKAAEAKPLGDLFQEIELAIVVPAEEPEVTLCEFIEHFKLLRCVPLGTLRAKVTADRLSCFPGDCVTVTVEVENTTNKHIQRVVVSLVREVIFSVDGREKFSVREVVASETIPGPPREKDFRAFGPQKVKVTVPTESQPSMTSSLMRLRYKLETFFLLGQKPYRFFLDCSVLKKTPTVKEHLTKLHAPKDWHKVPLLPETDLAVLQLRGARPPVRGDYIDIGSIIC
ncbi:arrestin (or s-antigen), n-terminal domain-containing protein [Toxoplasma gondii MAS]|uniref:Arrestin (Or s-antigen), n-terminal domain-containing protein n=1 Tax=Toxoplasma gondii MAS TaxID=943118 RepID=A0A086PNR7_TOXGO|nr:arrestin (or s-antigen), n-terminal domain-containing protein [Toxoplasma gondii MAS]